MRFQTDLPRLGGASLLAAFLFVFASTVSAQQPKDPPKDPPKETPGATDELKAREAFLAGKLDDSLKLLQAAVKANPALSPPKVILARWFVEVRQGDKARLMIEQAAIEEPGHPDVFLTNASFALAEGRVTDTILNCGTALSLSESARWDADTKKRYQREARLGLAAAFERRGDYASVKTHLVALLEADPKNAGLRQRLATAYFLLDRSEDAFAELQAAVKEDPTLDPPQLTMAQLWTVKQDFTKADEWYAKAVAAHPNSAKVHRGLAGYSIDRARIDTAKAHLAAAQKLEPTARETKALTGLVARCTKDYPTATTIFEELVKDYPSFGFGVMNLALTLAESGDMTGKRRATELAEGFATQNQRDGPARAVLAYCLYKAGRVADAEKVARSVEGLSALNPDAAYFVARILADREAIEPAHKLMKAACESKDGFIYRKDAEALLAELDKKLPPPKK
ncbi:MAG: tetratricopeptide repeat protein [Planctomycetes bacterium]|nr:tetratricopeptide repeat protein [Planctomycetota bacterium]